MSVRRLPTAYCLPPQSASRPVSRVLYGRKPRGCRRDGHSSGAPVAGRLEQPTRATDLRTGPARLAARASLLFGFAPGGACLAADVAADAVRSCRTLSPLPAIGRRFAFCGAVPEIALAGRYPAPCPHGARTFLRPKATAVRPTDGRQYAAAGRRVKRCDALTRIEAHQNGGRTSGVGEKRDGRRNVLLDVLPDSGRLSGRPFILSDTFTPAPPPFAPRRRAPAGWRRRARRRESADRRLGVDSFAKQRGGDREGEKRLQQLRPG